MNASLRKRRGLLIVFALAAALATSACGPVAGGESANPQSALDAAGGGSLGGAPTPEATVAPDAGPGPGPTTIALTYPETAKAYAAAVIKAWKDGQISALGGLTTPGVQEQILEIPAPVNHDWTFLRCDGAAGTQYCVSANANGDEFTVGISVALLGQPHGATSVAYDQTVYPNDGVDYVKEFVAAWQKGNTTRMNLLSKAGVVGKLNKAPLNPTYPAPTCCGGGLLQVKVSWAGSTVIFDVGTTLLGGPAAIVDYHPALGLTS